MVGDYFSRMAMAQKESPAQQQQSVQNGMLTPNMAKDAAQSQPQAAPQQQQQGQQPPVADQIMQEADQVMAPEKLLRQIDQLKSEIPQLQEAIQSGKLQAYEGIPLLKDKVATLKELEAQINPPQGVTQLASNLPQTPAGYAAGGVIAFAEGDLVDDDDETEDDRQEASLMALMDAARNKIQSGLGSATSRFTSMLPQSYEATKAAQQAAPTAPAEGGLSGLLSSAATKYGVPTALLSRISGSESSGSSDAANPRSSAKGVFQFTDSTWKGMGGKPGEQFNPEANVDLGAKYIRQNAEHLKSALGRDPTYHEVYAAHMFGPGVSRMLNKANPKDPIERGLSLFENPQQVRAIMKANPNLRGKTVGQVLDSLQDKTGEGIVALAQGGEIKHFAKAGEVESGTDNPYAMFGDIGASAKDYEESNIIDDLRKKFNIRTAKEAEGEERLNALTDADRAKFAATQEMENQEANKHAVIPVDTSAQNAPQVNPQGNPQGSPQGSPQTPVTEAVDPYLEKYMSMLQKRETESERQKGMDGYMALMQAGLGMMASKSPYALGGIGEGGTQGLTAYAAAQKQRAAEDAATLSGYGKLYTAKETAGLRRDLAAQNKGIAETRLGQDKETRLMSLIAGREKQLETVAYNNVIKSIGSSFSEMDENQKRAALNAETQRLKSQDKLLGKWYDEYGLPPIENTGTIAAVPDYSKLYGLTPKK